MAGAGDEDMKQQALDWISAVIGKNIPPPFEVTLKDGVILCELINKIVPGSVKRIAKSGGNFQLMENIAAYQKAVQKYGVPQEEIFQTVDLFEKRNIKQVVMHIHALGRIATNKGFDGPPLGPKMAEESKRGFTEEQNRQMRDGMISLQYGSNKGASQAGINLGKQRGVCD